MSYAFIAGLIKQIVLTASAFFCSGDIYFYEKFIFWLNCYRFCNAFFFSSVQEDIVTRDNLKQS
jgi:hypothetical protein